MLVLCPDFLKSPDHLIGFLYRFGISAGLNMFMCFVLDSYRRDCYAINHYETINIGTRNRMHQSPHARESRSYYMHTTYKYNV